MDFERFYPPAVRAALAYEPPGAWMPRIRRPDTIRLNRGYPFPAAVPVADLGAAAAALLAREGDAPFHYLGSPAMGRLPQLLASRSAQRGMPVGDGELMVTMGGAQAIDLTARILLGPDDLVAVEAPTYMEALETFRNYTPHIISYRMDEDGLDVTALSVDLAARRAAGQPLPKLLYTIPSFHNPTGTTLSPERRRQLLAMAEEYDFLILEDDAYGELAFGEIPIPLKAQDTKGRVIYAGSLSKTIAPGLRLGWVHAAAPLVAAMFCFKKDLENPYVQALAAEYLSTVDYGARVTALRESYRQRRDAMVDALRRHTPPDATWTVPQGGFFVWVWVPGADTVALLEAALDEGVGYVPGKYCFFGSGEGREHLRLSFSYLSPEEMERGVAILGRLMGGRRGDPAGANPR
ncbi:MAG TPA: PLP-dependent aminotransferase family protein [Symbiobacteriaceae bacterium]|nr:PLP-dependent aminotransferase family protein [Symbiobacteriaceae bacterium]